ncbi:MAG: AMP-binding protein [Clostridiales bacterium]|nr:AMP-binding protein [Clostridiales bacterium]
MYKKPFYESRKIGNLKEMLETSADLYADRTAFLVKNKQSDIYEPIKYSKFKEDVDAIGTAMCALGLSGGRVGIIGENRYEWAVSYMATINGTGVVVPIDKELPTGEISSLLTSAKVDALVFSGSIKEKVNEVIKNAGDTLNVRLWIDMDGSSGADGESDIASGQSVKATRSTNLAFSKLLEIGRKLLSEGDKSFTSAVIDPEVMSIILFTSATTDKSKAVMLSHSNISSNLVAMCNMTYIGKDDIFLSVLPMHHTYEYTCGFLCPIYRGGCVAFCEGLRHIPKNLQESKASVMLGVPLIFEAMYRRIWDQAAKKPETLKKLKLGLGITRLLGALGIDLRRKLFAPIHDAFGGNLRLLVSGAAGIDPHVSKGFRRLGMFLIQGYGLTECSPIVALNRDILFEDASAGLPMPGIEVRIDNPGHDGMGEIVVRGPCVMLGYYEDPEATAKVLKDGWFHTGDLGMMDKRSFVYITGRMKNVIVTKNGKNIYPEEIETLLNRSPYIKESLVYGKQVAGWDDVAVAAQIVPDIDKIQETKGGPLPADELVEAVHALIEADVRAVNKGLVLYKHIRDFKIRDTEFEKTTSKKIKRYMAKTN